MSVEEKVGQLFIVGFHSPKLTGEVIHLIETYKVGGFCLFNYNFRQPRQLHKLLTDLQLFAPINLPLFLATHQEGEHANNLTDGFTQSPSQGALGAINNRLYTKQMAEIVASELHAAGLNMNLAPALHKKNIEDENSFSNSIDLVAKHGVAAIQGYQNENISAVAKVFPGLEKFQAELLLTETFDMPTSQLYPFYQAVQKDVDGMLVSPQIVPSTATQDPALGSHSILYSLVREKLAFDGVIMMDFKETEISDELAPSAILAIQAGVNLLCLPKSYKTQITVIDAVIDAVKTGIISEEQLNKSVERILALKKKREIGKITPFDRDKFKTKRSRQFVERLEEKVISN